ncbi:MAG: hypothetical protein RL660_2361 [Bacteroidota bacterium]|jgi:gliding motility-associated lipoprotein GldH
MYYRVIFACIAVICLHSACVKSHRVQRTYATSTSGWQNSDEKVFEFYISDTSQRYNWLLMLQHTYDYNFSNIWLNVSTTLPNGKVLVQKQEVPLAFNDGRWMGRSVGGVCTQELNLGPNGEALKFDQVGLYKVKYKHIMRENPLMDVQQVGMALERLPVMQH